jgi:hypothetical protein
MRAAILSSAALVAVAAAAPTSMSHTANEARTAKALPGVFYVNGDKVDMTKANPTAVKSPCTVDDDVLTCAKKTAAVWKMLPGSPSQPTSVNLDAELIINGDLVGATLDLSFFNEMNYCTLEDPVITNHQDLFDCNDNAGK